MYFVKLFCLVTIPKILDTTGNEELIKTIADTFMAIFLAEVLLGLNLMDLTQGI